MRYGMSLVTVLLVTVVGCKGPGGSDTAKTPAPAESIPVTKTWPQFRGPAGDGVAADSARPKLTIDPAVDVRWRTDVGARGNSSPIVWGDRIFLTGEGYRMLAFDRESGKALWNTTLSVPGVEDLEYEPSEYGSASATACTDGERVYAFFGDAVLGCVDFDGKQRWAKRLTTQFNNTFGYAASPVVVDGLVIMVIDQEPNDDVEPPEYRSFIVALRAADGSEAWRVKRPVRSSWTTPLVLPGQAGAMIITAAEPWGIAYNAADGAELWRVGELLGDVAASPVADDKYVYLFSDPSGSLLAVRRGGSGDVTETHVAWTYDEGCPDVVSGLVDGRRVMQISDMYELQAIDVKTGESLWMIELPTTIYASPILVAGKVLVIDTDGTWRVIDPAVGKIEYETSLGEAVHASPAVVGDSIYVRGVKTLMRLGARKAG